MGRPEIQMAGLGKDAFARRFHDADYETSRCLVWRSATALMGKIPWTDAAVLVLLDDPDARRIVAEGTLRQMLNRIAARPPTEWHRFLISLPDRDAAPFAYRSSEFEALIRALAG